MTKIFKSVPIPIAGLMLGMAGLGNLISTYSIQYRYLAGFISLIIGILLLGRLLIDYENVFKELKHPILGSVALCFPMGIMILSTYFLNIFKPAASFLWYSGLILHIFLLILFSIRLINNINIKKVFPSFFIVYVGIVVASVTAPAFNHIKLGQYIFYFGFISYLMLLPIILYRVVKIGKIKRPALPTIAIFTAPAGLCLTGYMSVFPQKNIMFLGCLITLTLLSVIFVIIYLPKLLSKEFYPSFSAFTFPFVITAIGLKLSNNFLLQKYNISYLKYSVILLEIISIILVIFVLFKYTKFLFEKCT
ncbi:MAG TPA: TDT family transporter [Halanaerobiales bacterium]|nr:TDT family transporter [Halanaerobiales bacterium]